MGERLFKPLELGGLPLKHRVVMAPLTRLRADEKHVPSIHAKEMYGQRASVPGTLIITEATFISMAAGGYPNVPGIWSDEQTAAWKEIVDAVHAKGSYIYLQLWALGRVTGLDSTYIKSTGNRVVSASAIPVDDKHDVPDALTEQEIEQYVKDYVHATRNAMKAGFDGVEVHGANGYLIHQFWEDVSNQRTDKYGGSIENRARFGLEVTKAVIEEVGDSKKVGIRLSPFFDGQGMCMKEPIPQYSYIVEELKKLNLSYLHLTEARIAGKNAVEAVYKDLSRELDPFVDIWGTHAPIIIAGGYTPEKAKNVIDNVYTADNVLIAFGRYFISTPDLPFRLEHGLELEPYNRATFYTKGPVGYIDYPFSNEWLAHESKL